MESIKVAPQIPEDALVGSTGVPRTAEPETGAATSSKPERQSGSLPRLPPELTRFLELPGPQSLLIRGPPGSGKTTLGIALLESFPGMKVIVSSRVSSENICAGFPLLSRPEESGIHLIDASRLESSFGAVAQSVVKAREMLLGEVGTEGEIDQFLWLPSPIQKAWSMVSLAERAIVVIDSWDALVEMYVGGHGHSRDGSLPDRQEIERLLLAQMGASRAHLILVLERGEETQLDYLLNGVVVASRETFDERMERWLHILKLRNVRVETVSYPYTLEGGRFRAVMPHPPYHRWALGEPEPDPDPVPGYLWPGSRIFAEAFGRLQLGSGTLIEYDDGVPDEGALALTGPGAVSTLASGGRVIYIPPPSVAAEDILKIFRARFPAEKLAQSMSILSQIPESPDQLSDPSIIRPSKAGSSSNQSLMARLLRSRGDASEKETPTLIIMHTDGLGPIFRTGEVEESPAALGAKLTDYLHTMKCHIISVGAMGNMLNVSLRGSAPIHVLIRDRGGRLFVYGKRPRTPGFVIAQTSGEDSSFGTYDLMRIV